MWLALTYLKPTFLVPFNLIVLAATAAVIWAISIVNS